MSGCVLAPVPEKAGKRRHKHKHNQTQHIVTCCLPAQKVLPAPSLLRRAVSRVHRSPGQSHEAWLCQSTVRLCLACTDVVLRSRCRCLCLPAALLLLTPDLSQHLPPASQPTRHAPIRSPDSLDTLAARYHGGDSSQARHRRRRCLWKDLSAHVSRSWPGIYPWPARVAIDWNTR